MTTFSLILSLVLSSGMFAPAQPPKRILKADPGIQLYSLRDQFSKDVPGTLAWVKAQGITEVETAGYYGMTAQQFRGELDKAGLKAVSMHVGYDRLKNDIPGLVAEARAVGATYVGLAWYPHSGDFTMDMAKQAVAEFNAFGKALKDNGIQFFYHNHGYEFQPWEGQTLYDYIVNNTDPSLVALEMDVQWVVHPGQDPAALLRKYPSRFKLMHMKDLKKGIPTGNLSGGAGKDANVVMGQGQTDWPAVFKAARKSGIEHFLLEDESSIVTEQVPLSLKYLRGY